MTLGASWFEGFTLLEQVKWPLMVPLARKNLSNATKFANASLDYMTDGGFDALEIGNEPNLYPNASHPLKYNISDFVHGDAPAYYPGKSYVDWIGADGYNWAPDVAGQPWKSFAQIFTPFYRWGLPTGKPMLIGEYGTAEGKPGAKAAWFRQADGEIKTQFPALRAVVYFNSGQMHYLNWRVTSSKSALAAFKAFAKDPYFEARPAA